MRLGQRKHLDGMYRTIKGRKLICMTADMSVFEELINEAKAAKKLYRIIEGQLYIEQ